MSSDARLIATRYVEALFELAEKNQQHDAVKADMQKLSAVIEGSAEFQKLLNNPVISRENAQKAVMKVLDAIQASELTRKFFALLAQNRRLGIASLAIEGYIARLAGSRGELNVEVTSAQPLADMDLKTLSGAIAKSTGKKITIETREDPALIGGLKVRVGSQLLDNSVAGKLTRLKQTLSKAA